MRYSDLSTLLFQPLATIFWTFSLVSMPPDRIEIKYFSSLLYLCNSARKGSSVYQTGTKSNLSTISSKKDISSKLICFKHYKFILQNIIKVLETPLRSYIYSDCIPVSGNMKAYNWILISIEYWDLEKISKSLNFTSKWKDSDDTGNHN